MARAASVVVALALLLAGCGGSGRTPSAGEAAPNAGPQSEEVLRSKIVTGVGEDFRGGTQAGPRGYGICIRVGIGRALDRATLRRLLTVSRRSRGAAFAAQALNAIAVPIGDACGGRRFVPELVHAATALRGARLVDTRAHRIGLEYGPYLGVSCRRPSRRACDRIGISSSSGGRRARSPRSSPAGASSWSHPAPSRMTPARWAATGAASSRTPACGARGSSAPLPVRVAIVYPGGRRKTLQMPPVRVSAGFG